MQKNEYFGDEAPSVLIKKIKTNQKLDLCSQKAGFSHH